MPIDRRLIADCVHCGFCLPACPTYLLWSQEMDSPRGRIHLMQQIAGSVQPTPPMVKHIDACLGCLACVSACPSGVRYDQLIEQTREQVERHYARPFFDRLGRAALFSIVPYPARLRAVRPLVRAYRRLGIQWLLRASGMLHRLPDIVRAADALLPDLEAMEPLPPRMPARGRERQKVAQLTGCVQSVLFPHANAATMRVLAAEGCSVMVPSGQGCCGALSLHSGRIDEAKRLARAIVDQFEPLRADAVIVNAAGCGAAMKHYGDLLADEAAYGSRARLFAAKVHDFAEFLCQIGPVAPRHPLPAAVVYQDACHLRHAQGVIEQPRALLRGIPGIDLREPAEADICCGSAGIYNLMEPQPARELGDRKARTLRGTGASLVVSSNPGCTLQIRAALAHLGADVKIVHLAEILFASIEHRWPLGVGEAALR